MIKYPNCPSMDKQNVKYSNNNISAIKKNEILTYSKIQRQKPTNYDSTYMKSSKTVNPLRQKVNLWLQGQERGIIKCDG